MRRKAGKAILKSRISVVIPEQIHDHLSVLADNRGISFSSMVREVLAQHLDEATRLNHLAHELADDFIGEVEEIFPAPKKIGTCLEAVRWIETDATRP